MLLLYLSFRRVGEVMMIMLTLPLAMVGGLWLMHVLNYNFSIAVGVGYRASRCCGRNRCHHVGVPQPSVALQKTRCRTEPTKTSTC